MSEKLNYAPGTEGGLHVKDTALTTSKAAVASPSLLLNSIDRRIVKIRPSSTPIDQISRIAGSRHCDSMKVDYYAVDTKQTVSRCERGFSITADPDGEGTSNMVAFKVDDIRIFDVSETILVPADEAHGDLVGYVTGIDSDSNSLKVIFLNIKESVSVAGSTPIIRMGRAATELDVQTPQFQAMPKKSSNNCQIFKMQVEQSTLMKLANKEVGWTLTDQEEAAVIDMRMGMERTFLFGRRGVIADANKGEQVYLTEGIWYQAGQETELPLGKLTAEDYTALSAKTFTGNNGSRRKILVGGTELIKAIANCDFNRVATINDNVARWGIDAREIVSNFGHLLVVHSETFDQCGHAKDGIIIDPAYLTKYTHIPFQAQKLDLRKSGTRNTDAIVLTEASCLVLRHPNAHLRVIGV